MKISVLIITRNRAKMLEGCLNSLVKQTRLPDEVIVVDNASTDNTKKVILSFKKKLPIRYVKEKQIGIPYARNRGIKEASATLILMLDDDCEADKYWVENMIKAHKKYPKAWVIQGRTYSLPPTKIYSLLAEFDRFIFVRNYTAKINLSLKSFFNADFKSELELSTCDTNNFSIKTSYLKKYNLSFDENFYRGEDIDFGIQIVQKKGIIMFSPTIKVHHWERSSLAQVLKQRWYIGRTNARIANKWKKPSFNTNTYTKRVRTLIALPFFCNVMNQWHNFPMLIVLLFLDNIYRLNGYFYEKRILSLERR